MFTESLTPGPELENSLGGERTFIATSRDGGVAPRADLSATRNPDFIH